MLTKIYALPLFTAFVLAVFFIGAYAVINRDFARNCLQNYEFINREDDMGQENLRKAKLANFPVEIRAKYLAKLDVV